MRPSLSLAAALMAAAASPAAALTVYGTSSIYQIFGHAGNPGGDYGPATDAILASGSVGGGDIFSFDASGTIGCCSSVDSAFTPDGAPGNTSIGGANGLSSISGSSLIPLVGVFTTDGDPAGGVAPGALVFSSASPVSLAPALNQVFYIGDGHAGYNNSGGASLAFTAPAGARRLYLGVIDAFSFGGTTGYYNDNPGSFDVSVQVVSGAVPEPASWAMAIAGLAMTGAALRRRTRRVAHA